MIKPILEKMKTATNQISFFKMNRSIYLNFFIIFGACLVFFSYQNCADNQFSTETVDLPQTTTTPTPATPTPATPTPTPAPGLIDAWNGQAVFSNEQRICATEGPINNTLDFHYHLHDSGMALIEWPANSGIVYYFAEHRVSIPSVEGLEPHLYRSSDGGKTFTHITAIFNLDGKFDANGKCSLSTTPYWDLNGKIYCLFQLREPDVIFYKNNFYIVYDASGISSDGSIIGGPAVVQFSQLNDIKTPQKILIGKNFRQHPLLLGNYVGASNGDKVSTSTPVWHVGLNSISVFWTGISPINKSSSDQVNTYRGHYSSIPESSSANCFDPIFCYFSADETSISSPNLGIGIPGSFDSKNVDIKNVITEGDWNYAMYLGGTEPIPNRGVGLARSKSLKDWEKKYDPKKMHEAPYFQVTSGIMYGKFVVINKEFWLYFYDMRTIKENGTPIPGNVAINQFIDIPTFRQHI